MYKFLYLAWRKVYAHSRAVRGWIIYALAGFRVMMEDEEGNQEWERWNSRFYYGLLVQLGQSKFDEGKLTQLDCGCSVDRFGVFRYYMWRCPENHGNINGLLGEQED